MSGGSRQLFAALVVAAAVGLVATPSATQGPPASVQSGQVSLQDFKPKTLTLKFERLIVRVDDYDRLEIEYEIDRGSWDQLRDEEIALWLEMWIPLRIVYRFAGYPRLRDVRALTQREGTIRFPGWVRVDENNQVALCPKARAVVRKEEPRRVAVWACGGGPTSIRPRSSWGPQLSAGESFEMRRENQALVLSQWYWVTPFGWFVFPRPLPKVAPPKLPFREPRKGLNFPQGRRPR